MVGDVEQRVMRKILWRLMPILALGSAFNNVDRANIGVAAIKMNTDLGLTAAQFGLAAGIYYLSYVIFCIPANLVGLRIGLRKWLPATMIVWGLCSMATALAANAVELSIVRLLLGAVEASFVPGALFLIALWVPDAYRGRFVAWFWLAVSVGGVIASPISAYILTYDELAGLRSWQMLFVVEAAPVCLIGLSGFWLLHDDPTKAPWLSHAELRWLEEQHRRDPSGKPQTGVPKLREFGDPRVLLLSVAYFLIMTSALSFSFFLPSYLSTSGIDIVQIGVGLASAHFMGIVGHLTWGRWSDHVPHNREFVCFTAALTAAVSLSLLPLVSGLIPIMALSCATQMSFSGAVTSFWPMPMSAVRASATAGVIAGIMMFGNITGLIGPYLTGFLRDLSHSYVLPFTILGSCIALAGGLILVSRMFGSDNTMQVRPAPSGPH
jgi:MFS transporter, ACS family, tartrate transporter